MKKLLRLQDQGELATLIEHYVDKGTCIEFLIKDIQSDHPNIKKEDIISEVEKLLDMWLLLKNKLDEIQVTAWSHDGLCHAMKNDDFDACLRKLKKMNIYHCDTEG